jgi:hypothetical protein
MHDLSVMIMQLISNRMVMRESVNERDVWRFAGDLKLTKIREMSAPDRQGIVREVAWGLDPGVRLHYAVDYLSACSFVVIESDDYGHFRRLVLAATEVLYPWTLDELLGKVDYYSPPGNPRELAQAVIRLGVGAPNNYHDEVFARISLAMQSPEAWVRKAAIWATAYSRWPQFLPLLSEVADTDADPQLRSEARRMVDYDDESEVSE